jgi:hypothetical protein
MAERTVHLIDTPGFNDTSRSDGETFQELAYWLAAAHESKLQLSGIIYLHRITDVRLHGSAHRALKVFKAMCGTQAFRGVVVATTMWDGLVGDEIEKAHTRQIQLKDKIHGDVIMGGGKLTALSAGAIDARKVVHHILAKNVRMTLAFQIEHVDQGLPLHETGAGMVLYDSALTSLGSGQLSTNSTGNNVATVLEPLRATRGEVQTIWRERIRQEDETLGHVQRKFEEHAPLEPSPWHCSCSTQPSVTWSSLHGPPSTAFTPETGLDPECEIKRQYEGVMFRQKHKLDRRRIAYGRGTTTVGVVGTGLAVAQLAAAVACNVM